MTDALASELLLRRLDMNSGRSLVTLRPGDYYATNQPELIGTVLGSCIAVCLRDPERGIGGMNHFMLPEKAGEVEWGGIAASPARYGVAAMELLINDLMKLGTQRRRLEAKVFGGGRVLQGMTDIGKRNIAFIRGFVENEGLRVVGEDVGGDYPRQLVFYPDSGRVRMRYLAQQRDAALAVRERDYLSNINRRQPAGEVDLF